MKRRRALATGIAALLLGATATPWVLHASTSPPSSPSFPDFSNGGVFQETNPNTWALDVVTGGIQAGDPLSLTFAYQGKPGDHLHAVSFLSLGSGFAQNLTVTSQPALPGNPVGVATPRPTKCITGQKSYPTQASADPYGQTITLPSPATFAAGTVVVFCFAFGPIAFAPTPDPQGYAIHYTEGGQSIDAPYAVNPQATPPSSSVIRVLGTDGSDVTGAGVGGSNPLVHETRYKLVLQGSPTGQYQMGSTGFIDPKASADVVGDPGPTPACAGGPQLFCPDASGRATGTITLHGGGDVGYFAVGATNTARGGSTTEPDPSAISLSAGPPLATPPPVRTPPPTPPPAPGQSPPPKPGYDGACVGSLGPAPALGSLELYDANNQVFMPDFRQECPAAAKLLTFFGVTDEVALQSRFADSPPVFTFAGLDRPLSTQEYAQYGSTARGSTTGVQQFPLALEPLVVTYNLNAPGCDSGAVKLSSTVLSAIFTGVVTTWSQVATLDQANDANLAHCSLPILVAHDVGVTSSIFKDYLSKRNPVWSGYKQPQLAASWPGNAPVSCTANGSAAMALCVLGRPGTIGYGFYRAINAAGLPMAQVDNAAHAFYDAQATSPIAGCTAAADPAQNPSVPQQSSQDFGTATLTDVPVGYPICTFDFLTAPNNICAKPNIGRANLQTIYAYLTSVYTPFSQGHLSQRGFAPLPASLASTFSGQVTNLTCG
ncbi:MAG TPA: substrate-binding domain-containing protein [Candidatus Dormibacteraeota bacterium]|jgi:ABC-type phosphate transport system substrate-binding protein|nr:substrate-binding domain-containing protein [Candidatus Dormibacteraeota bacterium]